MAGDYNRSDMANPLHPTPHDSNFPSFGLAAIAAVKQEVELHRLARSETDDTYAVSFNPGRDLRGDAELADLRLGKHVSEWSRRLHTEGLRFHNGRLHKHKRHQPVYVLVSQVGARTWHSHGIAFVPHRHVQAFEGHAQRIWRAVCPGGDMDMEPEPNDGWLSYIARKITDRTQPLTMQTIPLPSSHRPYR